EENYIPLETQSQANTPVTPSEPEGSKGKGKRHSEGLITAKKWTPIATQRSRKPRNSASIQGKPTLTTCTGKITIINPVVTSKGKLPKDLGCQRHQPEDGEGLSRTRRPGRGKLGHSGGWQDIERNHNHSAIHIPIEQKPQTRGLEGYGSSSSAPTTPQRPFLMEHGQQGPQPGIPLGRTWSKPSEDLCQRDRLQRPYGNPQRLKSHQEVQTPGGEGKQHNNQQIVAQESPFFTIPGSFLEKTRTQGQKQDLFQPTAERVRPNDPEPGGFGERIAQEPEVAVNNPRISSPINRNITPTQIEHNVVTPESNLNSDALWLQMSQFAEQTQKQFSELEESHERMKTLTASMDKIVKTLQEGHAQLSEASEETNKRLNLVFEEQHHSKRDTDCLNKNIKNLFDFYHELKPQPQGLVMDNPYHQQDMKPYSMLVNKTRSPSQYQDGDTMSYSK
ncbi:hypothetical protein O181_078915, partial [Austropuccinia psidii MF-1]|nr:hypothetical protein [Austropuccinia psidii MF-1]